MLRPAWKCNYQWHLVPTDRKQYREYDLVPLIFLGIQQYGHKKGSQKQRIPGKSISITLGSLGNQGHSRFGFNKLHDIFIFNSIYQLCEAHKIQ